MKNAMIWRFPASGAALIFALCVACDDDSGGSGSGGGSDDVCANYEATINGCTDEFPGDPSDNCQDQVDKFAAQSDECKRLSEVYFECLASSDCDTLMNPAAACTAELMAIDASCDAVTPPGS